MNDEISIGTRLRQVRRERNLSQKELAALCGLSLNCISLIERDEISPNVATLQRLASALEVRMSYFFEESSAAEASEVIHVKEGALHSSVVRGPAQAADSTPLINSVVSLDGLCSSIEEEAIKPFVLTLKPHSCARTSSGYTAQAGHGFVYCLKGALECDLESETYTLGQGEALLFEGTAPRRCQNPDDAETQFLLIMQPTAASTRSLDLSPGEPVSYPSEVPAVPAVSAVAVATRSLSTFGKEARTSHALTTDNRQLPSPHQPCQAPR